MSSVPLEDQLRSMILKNSGPSDIEQPTSTGQYPPENDDAAAFQTQHQQFPPLPPPGSRGGRHQNRSRSQQIPAENANNASPNSPHASRRGPHHGSSHSGPGRPYFGPGSPQQRQHGFQSQQSSPGYVPPHMRHRSSEWHQQRGGFHQSRGSWHHQQPGQFGPAAVAQPSSPGNFGPRHSYRQSAPGPIQILQRPNPGGPANGSFRPGPPLYNPNPRYQQYQQQQQEQLQAQCRYLGDLAAIEIPEVAMTDDELREKELFVERLQEICQSQIASFPDVPSIQFKCFGSIGTGFATKGSDIDLAVVTLNADDTELAQKAGPRALERIFLDEGFGARLLTNTRVPIIKFCEKPSVELLANLKAERKKWDDLPEEEKKALLEGRSKSPEEDKEANTNEITGIVDAAGNEESPSPKDEDGSEAGKKASAKRRKNKPSTSKVATEDPGNDTTTQEKPGSNENEPSQSVNNGGGTVDAEEKTVDALQKREHRQEKPWLRERPMGPLDFPKEGVGIQCDLNFAGHLGIYNTRLLHCYAISDQRVRDMVIFVKAWAKRRKINSSYNGTLSSYGYALMVLHYLMRIPEQPVTPDLQLLSNVSVEGRSPEVVDVICNGHVVKFLADEEYIRDLVRAGQWTRNQDSLGSLLRGFFRYYGCPGVPDRVGGFHWTRDVITFGQRRPFERMVTKEELGWTKARIEKDSVSSRPIYPSKRDADKESHRKKKSATATSSASKTPSSSTTTSAAPSITRASAPSARSFAAPGASSTTRPTPAHTRTCSPPSTMTRLRPSSSAASPRRRSSPSPPLRPITIRHPNRRIAQAPCRSCRPRWVARPWAWRRRGGASFPRSMAPGARLLVATVRMASGPRLLLK